MTCTTLNAAWQSSYRQLHTLMLDAHERNDKEALVQLYTQAADIAEQNDDIDASRFYLTQAYVFALDTGRKEHELLKQRLDVLTT